MLPNFRILFYPRKPSFGIPLCNPTDQKFLKPIFKILLGNVPKGFFLQILCTNFTHDGHYDVYLKR